ncbi:uncharacterized protein [Amphiura filiformis]|uniref:uncharacterized protein isoform X2 n=1 Tax=Amphiura filiformis TaxID=82378 RepID=UPI003B222694
MEGTKEFTLVGKILSEASGVLSKTLQPKDILRSLKAKSALTPDDVEIIENEATDTDKVDKLLETLRRKPISAYATFMKVLEEEREDLYEKVKEIEDKYNYKRKPVGQVSPRQRNDTPHVPDPQPGKESSGPINVNELRNMTAELVKVVTESKVVRWKQDSFVGFGGDREQTYKECIYKTEKGNVIVFVQSDFETRSRIAFDSGFQYGLTKAYQLFFVLHDKRQKPYQKRFQITPTSDTLLARYDKTNQPSALDVSWMFGKYLREL